MALIRCHKIAFRNKHFIAVGIGVDLESMSTGHFVSAEVEEAVSEQVRRFHQLREFIVTVVADDSCGLGRDRAFRGKLCVELQAGKFR